MWSKASGWGGWELLQEFATEEAAKSRAVELSGVATPRAIPRGDTSVRGFEYQRGDESWLVEVAFERSGMSHTTTKPRPGYWLAGLALALVLLSLASAGLLAVRMDRVGEPAFVFLTWNLFLAWIPFVLSLCVAAVHGRGGPRLLLWVFGAGWLLFLPNAPYILTDFIHLGGVGGAPLWFDAALIGTFAAAGLALGLASLLVVHHVVEARAGRVVGWAVAVSSLVLSAIGIYLGRFPRFNSWNVVTDPRGLVAVVLQRLADPLGNPFLLRFGVVMTTLLLGSYLVTWVLGRGLLGPIRGRGRVARRLG